MRLFASPVNDENETVRKPGTVPSRFARLRQSLRSELIFRADYQIVNMKNRIIRCTQGLFGSQSLIVATLVIHICERGYFGNPP